MEAKLYGIGVGPGDPELLTVKAVKAIEQVDVLIAPKTEKKEGSVAYNIAQPYLKKDIEIERIKKGYAVKGVGVKKEFVTISDVNMK